MLGLIPSPFTGMLGVVLGILALRSIAAPPAQRGSAMARTGITFGALWTVLGLALVAIALLPPSVLH